MITEPSDLVTLTEIQQRRHIIVSAIGFCVFGIAVFGALFSYLSSPPATFMPHSTLVVEPGMGVANIADKLKQEGYVRSSNLFYAFLVLEHDSTNIQAGTYVFDEPLSVRALAQHISEVGPKDELLALTFPEGFTVEELATIADDNLPEFDRASFLSYAREYEGYLFPETYFVPAQFTDSQLFDLLRKTYMERIAPKQSEIESHSLTEYEILILASILEREANSFESMRMVSSVLQNRLDIGMPLQADASIEYALDKPLSQLTPEDLEIDSPYNTYLYAGLPPTPIGNPGEQAIDAVLDPAKTNFYYYITDNDGVFHYARTFDEHRLNIARYLR